MSDSRRVTIGVTINLDNYENVRLEVEDVCPTLEAVEDLKAYLDGILAGLGRSEENTRRKIDHYRARLLASKEAAPQKPPAPKETPLPPAEVAKNRKKAEELGLEPPAATNPGLTMQETAAALVKTGQVMKEAGVVGSVAPEKPPAPIESGIACENCGTAITKTQEKLSVMFLSKTLCKTCMDQWQAK